MKEQKFTMKSDFDGLTLHGMVFIPDGEAKGVVQLVHGMCEFKERYVEFMEFLYERR